MIVIKIQGYTWAQTCDVAHYTGPKRRSYQLSHDLTILLCDREFEIDRYNSTNIHCISKLLLKLVSTFLVEYTITNSNKCIESTR